MGAMPKRRNSNSNSNSNSSNDTRRIKSKHLRQQQQQQQQQHSQNTEDDPHTKATTHSSTSQQHRSPPHHSSHSNNDGSNGTRSNRYSSSDNHHSNNPNNPNGKHNSLPSRGGHGPSNHTRRKALDATLLARGMSSRSIGSRVSSQIRSLSLEEMEKDLRHMEVFGTACIAYAQQFFIYTNRESVSKGVYGPVPAPSPGLLAQQPGQSGNSEGDAADADADGNDGDANDGDGDDLSMTDGPDEIGSDSNKHNRTSADAVVSNNLCPPNPVDATSSGATGHKKKKKKSKKNKSSQSVVPGGGITMPVRIDPEEEKRLSILRKRVAASEAKREEVETEYISLLKHYVHEIHLLRHARRNMNGQLGLLKDSVRRRGQVVALRRVRLAIIRDILTCLKYRKANGGIDDGSNTHDKDPVITVANAINADAEQSSDTKPDDTANTASTTNTANTSNTTTAATTTTTKKEDLTKSNKVPEDLIDIWTMVESKLHEAELACSEVETPKELFQVKSALSIAVAAARNEGGTSTGNTTSSSSSDKGGDRLARSSSSGSSKNSKDSSNSGKDGNSYTSNSQSSSSRTEDGKNQQQDGDRDGSGSGNGTSHKVSKKKSSKGESSKQDNKGESSKQDNKGNGENQSNANTSTGDKDNNSATSGTSNNNDSNKGSGKKSHKRAASSNNADTTMEESSVVVTDTSSNGSNAVITAGAEDSNPVNNPTSSKNNHAKSKKKHSSSSSSNHNNVNLDDQDDNIIPWSCQILPRTPYDVSVFISNLSTVPDGAAAFGCGNIFGNEESSMIWLESNLPRPSSPSTSSKMRAEAQKLVRLRREVRELSEKRQADVSKNRELQNDLIDNRKRCDELSAMISMLRTETEAVLHRHNGILETPEARERAAELMKAKSRAKADASDQGIEEEEEEDLESNSEEEEEDDELEDEEELDEKDKLSDGGTVIEDEDGDGGMNPYEADDTAAAGVGDGHTDPFDSVEEGEIHEEGQTVMEGTNVDVESGESGDIDGENGEDEEEEDEDGFQDAVKRKSRHLIQPIREVIVPRLSSGGQNEGEGQQQEEGQGGNTEVDEEDGEINEGYNTVAGFEVGKRVFSEVTEGGGSGDVSTANLPFSGNDQDKKRRRV